MNDNDGSRVDDNSDIIAVLTCKVGSTYSREEDDCSIDGPAELEDDDHEESKDGGDEKD